MIDVTRGGLNESLAYPRDIFRPVITHSAYSFILLHNHPSGDPSPSEADLRLTRRLSEAARILQIQMLDHVIIGHPVNERQGYFSFREAATIGSLCSDCSPLFFSVTRGETKGSLKRWDSEGSGSCY